MRGLQAIAYVLSLLTFIHSSCSEERVEMSAGEAEIAKQADAENVRLAHINSSRTVNGISTGGDLYLRIDITNSKKLKQVEENERLFRRQCEAIKNKVLGLPELQALPAFNEVQFNVIDVRGALFFKTQNTKTITYRIH
jgi:hypothetical protein